MATAPNQGIMALPENQDMQTPQLSLTDSYDAMRQALQTARPDADMEMEEALQEIRPMIDELTDEQLSLLIEAIQALYDSPENYDKIVQELVRGQFIESAEELPPEYDEQFIATLLMLLIDNQRARTGAKAATAPPLTPELSPPQNFARGGIAEAARMVAGYGRNGDTMLAHITPEEARLLKARGGSGTINPQTGLPEFWPLLSRKRGIGKAVTKALSSPIGRIIGTIALGAVLGPAVGAFMPGLSAAATAGITGALSSGIVTAATGGDLKSILTSAAVGFFSAPGGPVSNYIGKYTASLGVTNPIVNQALSGAVVGTGAGLISGQGLKSAIRSGLIEGAIAGGVALVSGAPKVDVDNAARTKASAATQAASAAEAVGATPLDVDAGTNAAIDDFLGKNKPDVMGAQRIADEAQVTGAFTRPASADTSIVRKTYSDGRITEQLIDKQGVPLLDESIIAPSTPKVSAAPTKFGMDAPFPGSDVRRADGIKGLVLGEGVGQAQLSGINPPTPPVSAAPTQFGTAAEFPGTTPRPAGANTQLAAAQTPLNIPVPSRASVLGPEGYTPTGELLPSLDYADNVQYMSYPGEFPNTEIPGVTTAYVGDKSAAAPYTVPEYGESFAKMGRGAKQFLSGDLKEGGKQFLQGAEDLFFPGPSGAQKQAMLDEVMAKYPKYTPDQAIDYLKEGNRLPGFMRTYGPGTAAGIGALALAGGFKTDPALETEEQRRMRERMLGPIDLSSNPRKYYVQGLPGVSYNQQGAITGGEQWSPLATMADVTTGYGYSYAPAYMNMGGLMETKGHSAQPSYNFMGSPQYMNMGGIAALAQGGYPRKIGQISGPGTEKSDSIPAMLSDGEFVMTAKAVRGAGGGSRREGAKRMYALMHQLERNAARG